MESILSLSLSALQAFRDVPREGPRRADALLAKGGRLERLRIARRLEATRLVEPIALRPKTLRVRPLPFPLALHAALNDDPRILPVLRGNGLLVLGILATSPRPLGAGEVSRLANLHRNTTYPILRLFGRRALLAKARSQYALHDDADLYAKLGRMFLEHNQLPILEQHPTCLPLHHHYGRLIVQGSRHLRGLPPTGAYFLQSRGADVLAKAPTHAIIVSGARLTTHDAYEDFLATKPAPRTRRAVDSFMNRRRR